MFHPQGYGGIFRKDLIYDPVSKEGLLVAGCLENGWPRTPEEVDSMYDIIAANLSVSKEIIQGSTFEDFYKAIDKSKLPVYKGEFGNDWNRASMGDPKKTAMLRAFGRVYQPPSSKATVERLVAEVFSLAAGEHNYGVFYRGGGPWTDYSNHIGPASWDEQRNMTNITALALLAEVDTAMAKKTTSRAVPVKSRSARYNLTRPSLQCKNKWALQRSHAQHHWHTTRHCAVGCRPQLQRSHRVSGSQGEWKNPATCQFVEPAGTCCYSGPRHPPNPERLDRPP